MALNSVDLHLHSRFSDGSDEASELLTMLQARGITTFALTDHDTVEGCEAVNALLPAGLRFIPGIEFSSRTARGKCHLLGLGITPSQPTLVAAIAKGKALRDEKARVRLKHLQTVHKVDFTEEELAYLRSQASIGKPHFAAILVQKGMADSIGTAIKRYLDDCPTSPARLEAHEAIEAVTAAGGIPVWAHPLGGEGERHLTADEFEARLALLLDAGIRGLECYYSRYDRREIALLLDAATRHELLISGGSDYHGTRKTIAAGTLSSDGLTVTQADLTVLNAIL